MMATKRMPRLRCEDGRPWRFKGQATSIGLMDLNKLPNGISNNIPESRYMRPYDQGVPDGGYRGPNHTTTAKFYPGNSFQAAYNYEGTFPPRPFSNNPSFQHAPPALPPFPDHVPAEISYFELPISSPFISLALSASERPQPVPPFQPSTLLVSAPIPAHVSQASGRRCFECPICPKNFPRIARAKACLNGHFQLKPHACDGTCGDSNCDLEYGSIELLRRHRSDHRKTPCPTCKRSILKQNAARHKARCNKSRFT